VQTDEKSKSSTPSDTETDIDPDTHISGARKRKLTQPVKIKQVI